MVVVIFPIFHLVDQSSIVGIGTAHRHRVYATVRHQSVSPSIPLATTVGLLLWAQQPKAIS